MTTLRKITLGTTLAVAISTGIYEARQAASARAQVEALREQQALFTKQIQQLSRECDVATNRLAELRHENEQSSSEHVELLRLRSLVGSLRKEIESARNSLRSSAKISQPHPAWKLQEARRPSEFENVGRETVMAAAETAIWAALNQPTNLLQMVYLPPEKLDQLQNETDLWEFATELAKLVGRNAGEKTNDQVWVSRERSGISCYFNSTVKEVKSAINYVGVVELQVSRRLDMSDPKSERSNDMLFTKITGDWKLVLPWISPAIPGQ